MHSVEFYIQTMISKIREYGFDNQAVLDAMRKIPRHLFVPERVSTAEAYADSPIPIGEEQTISQPYTVALMLDLMELERGNNVLEIGTGSGWNAALIKHQIGRSGRITTLECIYELAARADLNLKRLNLKVEVHNEDGSNGFPERAPYDRIIVTCAAPIIYNSWIDQLKPGGIIVVPVGAYHQEMIRVIKKPDGLRIQKHGHCRFVPLRVGLDDDRD
jgi:protein-L-isoaspartate(D-aspartate) O-methyltransferase